MPPRPRRRRVMDIIEQIDKTLRDTAGVDQTGFDADEVLQDAVAYRITIIGEAVAAIPEEIRDRAAAIPWHDIRNMRNMLSHVHFLIDRDRAWEAIRIHMPVLREQFLQFLEDQGPETIES